MVEFDLITGFLGAGKNDISAELCGISHRGKEKISGFWRMISVQLMWT